MANKSNFYRVVIGVLVVLLAAVLLLPKFLPLMINADSYAILLSTKLWVENGYIGGLLGDGGDFFYPLFYRGGFSILILFLHLISKIDPYLIAKFLILLSFAGSGVAMFLVIKRLFSSVWASVISAILLYLSFSFQAWSSVLMAETMTIFIFLLSLLCLVNSRKNIWLFYLSAILFGLLATYRLEMFVLFFGMYYLIDNIFVGNLRLKFIYPIISFFVWVGYEVLLYFLMQDSGLWLFDQVTRLWQTVEFHQLFLYLMIIFGLFLILIRYLRWLIFIPVGMMVYVFWKLNLDWGNIILPLVTFLANDWVILVLASVGWFLMLFNKSRAWTIVSLWFFSLLILYASRGEYRYYVHLISVLVIVAGYLISKMIDTKNKYLRYGFLLMIMVLLGWQVTNIKSSRFLPERGYEQEVLRYTKNIIDKKEMGDVTVCSMFSEAMYYETGLSSVDCFEGKKDLDRIKSANVLIVVGEDMSRHQREFVEYLENEYSQDLIGEEWVLVPYVEKNNYSVPQYPVRWFYISL